MKDFGITECLMGKEYNFSKTGRDLKEISKKTNFMVKEYFTKMNRLFMVYGKIMNFL